MALTDVSIKMDETLKMRFEEFCEELGLTVSSAINLFIKTAIREQKIPFELSLKPSEVDIMASIFKAEESGINGPYETVDDAMKAMLADE